MRRRLTLWFWLVAMLGVAASGQQGHRGPKRGLVRCTARLVDGSPWGAAEVLFVSRPIATHPELEGADVVRAQTNERGIARARLGEVNT